MEKSEVWRPVRGFEGFYEVSNYGRVRRVCAGVATWPGRILRPFIHTKGCVRVSLSVNCVVVRKYVHVLVADAFLGECPPGLEVNHKNTIKTDNRPENLEYITHRQNTTHAKEKGLYANRKRPGTSKTQ